MVFERDRECLSSPALVVGPLPFSVPSKAYVARLLGGLHAELMPPLAATRVARASRVGARRLAPCDALTLLFVAAVRS